MGFPKYPLEIEDDTVSNLIIVDKQDVDEGDRDFFPDYNTFGFTDFSTLEMFF